MRPSGKLADYTFPYPTPAPNEPTPGTLGPRIEAQSQFDGWGYARLINLTSMAELDQLAIKPDRRSDVQVNFGDLWIHEVEGSR